MDDWSPVFRPFDTHLRILRQQLSLQLMEQMSAFDIREIRGQRQSSTDFETTLLTHSRTNPYLAHLPNRRYSTG
jgi:hypothetical protein